MYCDPDLKRFPEPDSYTLLLMIDAFSAKYPPLAEELLTKYALYYFP